LLDRGKLAVHGSSAEPQWINHASPDKAHVTSRFDDSRATSKKKLVA
jgi:hypothetical protein